MVFDDACMIVQVNDKVEKILERNTSARDSDKILIYDYLKTYHNIELPIEIFNSGVPSFESIRRQRQKLQQFGKYPATDLCKARRQELEEAYRFTHGR